MSKSVDDTFQMNVNGVGNVLLPLSTQTAQQLIALAKHSQFSQKVKTVHNKHARNSWQLDPSQLMLSQSWLQNLRAEVFNQVNEDMSLCMSGPEELELSLDKLLLSETGAHFPKHRDTENNHNTFGTLIVVLPNHFGGGTLFVQQTDWIKTYFSADAIKRAGRSEWAAFFADCECEFKPITEGCQIALSFNMVRKRTQGENGSCRARVVDQNKVDSVAKALTTWVHGGCKALGILLEHRYSLDSFNEDALTSLKGTDADIYATFQAAVEKMEFDIGAVAASPASTSSTSSSSSVSTSTHSKGRFAIHLCEVNGKRFSFAWNRYIRASGFAFNSFLGALTGSEKESFVNLSYLMRPPGVKERRLYENEIDLIKRLISGGTTPLYRRTAIVLVDGSSPWQYLHGTPWPKKHDRVFDRPPSMLSDAVTALVAGGTALASSHVGRIIAASRQVSGSPLEQMADLADSIVHRIAKKRKVPVGCWSRRDFVEEVEVIDGAQEIVVGVSNTLLRFHAHCVQTKELLIAQRIESLLKELLDAKDWFLVFRFVPLDDENPFQGPIGEFLLRLSAFNEEDVKKWLQARIQESRDEFQSIIQLAKIIKSERKLRELPKVADGFPFLMQAVRELALVACSQTLRRLIPAVRNSASSTATSRAPAWINSSPVSTNLFSETSLTPVSERELLKQLPPVRKLSSICSLSDLLRFIECVDLVTADRCKTTELILSRFVGALQLKSPPIDFIQGRLQHTLQELLRYKQPCPPIQQLYAFAVARLEQEIQPLPAAGAEWKYPLNILVSDDSDDDDDDTNERPPSDFIQFLASNKPEILITGPAKVLRDLKEEWAGKFGSHRRKDPSGLIVGDDSWNLHIDTNYIASKRIILVCKAASNLEFVHERNKANAKLLVVLRRAYKASNSSESTSSTDVSINTSEVNLFLSYDVAKAEARGRKLRAESMQEYLRQSSYLGLGLYSSGTGRDSKRARR